MKALRLVQKLGEKLIGKKIHTPACGDYPGGLATVTEIEPDKNVPEIAFQVSLPQWGNMGVLWHEEISVSLDRLGSIGLHENWTN
jgi:hypothetical protein